MSDQLHRQERSAAVISDCGQYRYLLTRRWAGAGGSVPLLFIMLNPSTADAFINDPTIVRCIGFAKAHGYEAMQVVNLFAYRATKPAELKRAHWPVGPRNDEFLRTALQWAGDVCCAWGAHADGLARPAEVMALMHEMGKQPKCLAITKHGHPGHPLMLPASARLQPYSLQAISDAICDGR